jgi:hypothetical protein
MQLKSLVASLVLAGCAGLAQAYVVGGASGASASNSGGWAWDGLYLQNFRAALENPANFGPAGVVNRTITTTNLAVVDSTTLAGLDMFVGAWNEDSQAAGYATAVRNFFLAGGDLFLLQDDSGHDALGAILGISTSASTGTVSNGGAPLFQGPFGNATNVTQHYLVGQLDETAVNNLGGTVAGRNANNQVTSAYWRAGEYAAGAGSLFVIADIDMIATTLNSNSACPVALCGADYAAMNSNAIYALNTFSFLQQNGGSRVPVPGSVPLVALGLGLLALGQRKRA